MKLKLRRSKRNGKFYWNVRGANNEIVCGGASEGYERKAGLQIIRKVCSAEIIAQLDALLAELDAK